jgi:hypothetical protein
MVTTPTTASVNSAVSVGEKSSPTIMYDPVVGRFRPNWIPEEISSIIEGSR